MGLVWEKHRSRRIGILNSPDDYLAAMHGIGQLGRAAHGEDKGLEVVALYVDILQVPVLGEIDRVQFAFAQPKLLQIGELSKVFVGADLEHIGAVLREDQRLERIGLCFRYVSVVVRIALEECPPLHALVCKGKRLRYGIGSYEKTDVHPFGCRRYGGGTCNDSSS